MLDIQIKEEKGVSVVDSRLLHKKLEVKSYHADWIRRRIENYGFELNCDYFLLLKNEKQKGSGGHNAKTYLISLDMAKELCMLENNNIGKATRKYFIKAEKQLRKHEAVRIASKRARRSLTDVVQESGENERMHGKGYGNYTRLVYSLTGLTEKKKAYGNKDGFRDTLSAEELKRVEIVESMIKPLLEMDKQYSEIKEIIKPLFEQKKVEK